MRASPAPPFAPCFALPSSLSRRRRDFESRSTGIGSRPCLLRYASTNDPVQVMQSVDGLDDPLTLCTPLPAPQRPSSTHLIATRTGEAMPGAMTVLRPRFFQPRVTSLAVSTSAYAAFSAARIWSCRSDWRFLKTLGASSGRSHREGKPTHEAARGGPARCII